jgi:hypothetical protein
MIGVAACVALWFALAPPPADEAPDQDGRDANPHFTAARDGFVVEDWETAARQFAAAFAVDAGPEYLNAQAPTVDGESFGAVCRPKSRGIPRTMASAVPPTAACTSPARSGARRVRSTPGSPGLHLSAIVGRQKRTDEDCSQSTPRDAVRGRAIMSVRPPAFHIWAASIAASGSDAFQYRRAPDPE